MDRYPRIFAACRDYFGGAPDLRILSYGCATGEEVLTLRRYFPAATIVGAEINEYCLAVARRHAVDDRIAFIESDSAAIRSRAPFDAIFCMAVLQRTPTLVAGRGIQDLKDPPCAVRIEPRDRRSPLRALDNRAAPRRREPEVRPRQPTLRRRPERRRQAVTPAVFAAGAFT